MEIREPLHGTLILVRPGLQNDPAHKQAQIGVVTYDRSRDEIYVGFPSGEEGVYAGEALLRLKHKNDISAELVRDGPSMPLSDFKAMYKIMLLLDRETARAAYDALALARDNPGLWDRALQPAVPAEEVNIAKNYFR